LSSENTPPSSSGHFDRIYTMLRDIAVGQAKLETSLGHVKAEQEKTSVAVVRMGTAQATLASELKEARHDIRQVQSSVPAFLTARDLVDPLRRVGELEGQGTWLTRRLIAASLGSGAGGGAILVAIAKLLGIKIGG
jgi:hypothetical protein